MVPVYPLTAFKAHGRDIPQSQVGDSSHEARNPHFQAIPVAIDAADVLNLRKAADRAVIKGKTLKTALQTKWKTEVPRDDA